MNKPRLDAMTQTRISRNRIAATAILALLIGNSACSSRAIKSLGELAVLQSVIKKEFGDEGVQVNLNNESFLTVTFINSPLNEKNQEQRAERAKKTAAVVVKHYPSSKKLQEIWVGFLRQETRYLVVTYSEGLDGFAFDRNGKPLSEPGATIKDLEPVATYFPTRNLTDVSVPSIQLSGTVDNGLTLAPHFTVTGDATKSREAGPENVAFDFASYSRNDAYPGELAIQISIDGAVAFKSKGTFSGAKSPDGTYAKYLYVKLNYRQFRRLVGGESVVIKLGDEEYPLTQHQLAALREMTNYVEE
jgi:hypothetical protein